MEGNFVQFSILQGYFSPVSIFYIVQCLCPDHMVVVIINTRGHAQDCFESIIITLSLLACDNHIVDWLEYSDMLLPLWYQYTMRAIELLDPT